MIHDAAGIVRSMIHDAMGIVRWMIHDAAGIGRSMIHDGGWAEAHPCGTAPRIEQPVGF
jgi:hypothetical protein